MPSPSAPSAPPRPAPIETTLLRLVQVLGDLTDDDRLIGALVAQMIADGRVRLTGNFANQRLTLD